MSLADTMALAVSTPVKVYDATANTWSSGAVMPEAKYGADGGLIAGNIYVAGGASTAGTATTTLYRYTIIATNTWSAALAPMAVGCLYGATGVDNSGRLYIAGGGFCLNAANPTIGPSVTTRSLTHGRRSIH